MNPQRLTAARYLQCLIVAKGNLQGARAYAEGQGHWLDRSQIATTFKMAVEGSVSGDFPGAVGGPVRDAFLLVLRDSEIPSRLEALRRVAPRTRIYADSAGTVAAKVVQGSAIPVVKGNFAETTLAPDTFAAITVVTAEMGLATDPGTQDSIVTDLAGAVGEAVNVGFLDPNVTGSILENAPTFTGSGGTVANVDTDLRRLLDLVPGASRPGAAWCMPRSTANYLSLLRGSGGAAAFPNITPAGGTLLGLPVLLTEALSDQSSPPTSMLALVASSEIYFAEDQVIALSASQQASIEMSDAPTGDSSDGTQGIASIVSMFQSNSIALRAVRSASWYPRSNAAAWYATGF